MYADDVVSSLTGKFSKQRYISQGRFFRLVDSYYHTGEFDFSCMLRTRIQPSNEYYRQVYEKFCSDLKNEYDNENTRHFYEYGMYSLLHYLENNGIFLQLEELTPAILIEYLTQSKPSRQREVLCELRKICRYLGRNDLLLLRPLNHNTNFSTHTAECTLGFCGQTVSSLFQDASGACA